MDLQQLQSEIDAGVAFCGCEQDGALVGIMGIQAVRDVDLIRHAYVHPARQRSGIGAVLLQHYLRNRASRRILVGTWAAAHWAIDFYTRNGFQARVEGTGRRAPEDLLVDSRPAGTNVGRAGIAGVSAPQRDVTECGVSHDASGGVLPQGATTVFIEAHAGTGIQSNEHQRRDRGGDAAALRRHHAGREPGVVFTTAAATTPRSRSRRSMLGEPVL